VYEISKSIDFNEIPLVSSDFIDFTVISLISNIYNYLNYYISNCVLTLIFAFYHDLELMDSSARISSLKWSSGAGLTLSNPLFAQGAYGLEIISACSKQARIILNL